MTTPGDPILERYAAATGADNGDVRTANGCRFGAVADLEGIPDAAVRVSLGCANPVAVAERQPGETLLDLSGSIDVLLSARRVGPTGFADPIRCYSSAFAWAARS